MNSLFLSLVFFFLQAALDRRRVVALTKHRRNTSPVYVAPSEMFYPDVDYTNINLRDNCNHMELIKRCRQGRWKTPKNMTLYSKMALSFEECERRRATCVRMRLHRFTNSRRREKVRDREKERERERETRREEEGGGERGGVRGRVRGGGGEEVVSLAVATHHWKHSWLPGYEVLRDSSHHDAEYAKWEKRCANMDVFKVVGNRKTYLVRKC